MGMHPLDRFGAPDAVFRQIEPLLQGARMDYLRFDGPLAPASWRDDNCTASMQQIHQEHPLVQMAEMLQLVADSASDAPVVIPAQTEAMDNKKRKRLSVEAEENHSIEVVIPIGSEVQRTDPDEPPKDPSPARKIIKRRGRSDGKDSSKMDWHAFDDAGLTGVGSAMALDAGSSDGFERSSASRESLVDGEGLPTLHAMSFVARQLKKIVDAGFGSPLMALIDLEDGGGPEDPVGAATSDAVASNGSVSRFLKMCEACLQRLEIVDCGLALPLTRSSPAKPLAVTARDAGRRLSSVKRRRTASGAVAVIADDSVVAADGPEEALPDASTIEERLTTGLTRVELGIELAVACVELLLCGSAASSGPTANRNLYSEDLLTALFTFLKNRFEDVIFSAVDISFRAGGEARNLAQLKYEILERYARAHPEPTSNLLVLDIKRRIGIFVDRICDVLRTLSELLMIQRFADSVIVQ
ncbi:hypothetical protein HK405_011168, partial [Cladochytrium tenue]